jgi:predicted RNA-binding protein with PIN domain
MAMTIDKQTSDIFDKNRVKYLRQISEIRHTQKTDLKRERRPTEYVQCRAVYTVWTEDQAEQLTKLWATDLSAREIAGELGVTKKAVLGKVRRLGLATQRNPAAIIAENKQTLNAEKPKYLFR